jgi:hypothetical protein
MSTVRALLPDFARPFTEVIVGATLGALTSSFVLNKHASTGAIVGAIAGAGVAMTKKTGMFPFVSAGGYYAGADDAAADGSAALPPPPVASEVVEEVALPPYGQSWPHHYRHGWGYPGHGGGWDHRRWRR